MLILGASSEVGCQLIEHTSTQYTKIIAHYNQTKDRLTNLSKNSTAEFCLEQADFSNRASTDYFLECLKKYNEITDIVHCPAVYPINERFHKMDPDRFAISYQVQFQSIVQILRLCLPAMVKAKKGRIIFLLTSYTEAIPPAYLADYVSMKYALLGLMKALSSEYSAKGLCINAVSPSMMETRFLKNIPSVVVEEMRMNSPRKQLVSVLDAVNAMKFLLSDHANAITGQNIFITGGSH